MENPPASERDTPHSTTSSLSLLRPESRISAYSMDSTLGLLDRNPSGDDTCAQHPSGALPLYRAPQQSGLRKMKWSGLAKSGTHIKTLCRGWRLIFLGSWIHVLLILIPLSWILDFAVPNLHGLVFICCILSLIPLVKLHDLATRELAIRIGGSKTGLLNASMGNVVEIVVAISALRQCELRVVQSSLVGTMLTKLLLVLGMCFFAGGMRFSEQDFDPTATQIHSSLLSISVGAVLLPAAFHFSLSGGTNATQEEKRNILRMSHGVSIVLLFIYASYLIFQLWSHDYLYKDIHRASDRLSAKVPKGTRTIIRREQRNRQSSAMHGDNASAADLGEWARDLRLPAPSTSVDSAVLAPPHPLYLGSRFWTGSPDASRSELTLSSPCLAAEQADGLSPPEAAINSTVRLVHGTGGVPLSREESIGSGYFSSASSSSPMRDEKLRYDNGPQRYEQDSEVKSEDPEVPGDVKEVPELSWPMTLFLLVAVTVVVAVIADRLVESMDDISTTISKQWIGLILLPAVTSIAECMTAVNVSVKDQLTFSINIAVGSTIQTALFVIPFMVTLAWAMGKPLALLFDPFESVVLYISVQTMTYVVADGKSNWLEGVILVCLYVVIAVAFWYYPGSNLSSSLAVCAVDP